MSDARRILGDVEALSTSARRIEKSMPGMIRLAIGEDVASSSFARLLRMLKERNTCLEPEVREVLNAEAFRLVRQGGSDLAITFDGRREAELTRTRGWSEALKIIVPVGHRLGKEEIVDLGELTTETIAIPSVVGGTGYSAQIESLLKKHQIKPAGWRVIRNWNTAAALTATGHAISLCPVTLMLHQGTVAIPIQQADAVLVTWLFHQESDTSPAVRLLLELAREISGQPVTPDLDEVDF